MAKVNDVEKGYVVLQHGRAYVKQKAPYFYKTLLALMPRHVEGINTMFVTNSWHLGIDMRWLSTLSAEVCGGCLVHEVTHVLSNHLPRINSMPKPDLAAYASDIPINDGLKAAGWRLPDWVVYSSTHNLQPGLPVEKYYELLEKMKFDPPSQLGAGSCGSCAAPHSDPMTILDPGRSESEINYFRKSGLKEIKDYAKSHPGSIPNNLTEFLDFSDAPNPIIPWESIFAGKLTRAFGNIRYGHADYSMRRPAKRSYTIGLLRPGMIAHEPNVVIIEDSSLSMSNSQLVPNRKEMVSALKKLGVRKVWFLCADVVAQGAPRLIDVEDLLRLPTVGRGGTSFKQPIDTVMRLHPKPNLILYSTDGGALDAPSIQPTGTEFVWLLAPGPWTRKPCAWGIQILTSNDPDVRQKYQLL